MPAMVGPVMVVIALPTSVPVQHPCPGGEGDAPEPDTAFHPAWRSASSGTCCRYQRQAPRRCRVRAGSRPGSRQEVASWNHEYLVDPRKLDV
jgi:hypothetical protein